MMSYVDAWHGSGWEVVGKLLGSVLGSDFRGNEIEVACVQGKEGRFRCLTEEEIEEHLNAIADDADA